MKITPILPCSESMYSAPKNYKRIVSFWDMLQIDTREFLASLTYISGALGEYKFMLTLANAGGAFAVSSPIEQRAHVVKSIQRLQENCQMHGLKTSEKMAKSASDTCTEVLAGDDWYRPYNLQRLITCLEGLINATVAEAESRKFYILAGDVNDKHDDADTLFGECVVDVFPHAAFDISQAGKCLSFGLWTACVMHTMRVLEIGLQGLAAHVEVSPSDNWNKTLNEIEASLRKINRKSAGADAEQWAAEAGTHLRFIKNAWRNQAMHHVSKYDEPEAKAIFANAKSFMKHLADKLETDI